MDLIDFVIPLNRNDLLEASENYFVREVYEVSEIRDRLKQAKVSLKEDGVDFILENFDAYFSVIMHGEKVSVPLVLQSVTDLCSACEQFNNQLEMVLKDSDSTEEVKYKHLVLMKMLFYLFSNLALLAESKAAINFSGARSVLKIKGSRKKAAIGSEDLFDFGLKHRILRVMHNLLQKNLDMLWDPPVTEENFITLIGDVVYLFLECPSVKQEKAFRETCFHILGTLLKNYNFGMKFVLQIVQLIKAHEHSVVVVPPGIKILVEEYSCKSIIRLIVREVTEWQTDEQYQDSQGTKNCSNFLVDMAVSMPELMIPEVNYLLKYTNHESYTVRNCVLSVITEVILKVLTAETMDAQKRETRDEFLGTLEDHILDVAATVRSKVLMHWGRLHTEGAIPLRIQLSILRKAVGRLKDKVATVRKSALALITIFLTCNPYAAHLDLPKLQQELVVEKENLDKLVSSSMLGMIEKASERSDIWKEKVDSLREYILEKLDSEMEPEPEPERESEKSFAKDEDGDVIMKEPSPEKPAEPPSIHDVASVVQEHLMENRIEEAVDVCMNAEQHFGGVREKRRLLAKEQQADVFLMLMHNLFTDVELSLAALKAQLNDPELFQKNLTEKNRLESTIRYLQDAVDFLTEIEEVAPRVQVLLHSTTIGDTLGAIEFFVTAFQFKIKSAMVGISDMLTLMRSNEVERTDAVIKAYRTMYLTSDSNNVEEHSSQIVNRLVALVQTVTVDNMSNLSQIMSQWVTDGLLNNAIVEYLWSLVLKKTDGVSDDDSRAALCVLEMCAHGQRSIVSKNFNLMINHGLGERGANDILFAIETCKFLTIFGSEKETPDESYRVRLKNTNLWDNLFDVIFAHIFKQNIFFSDLITAAIRLIYKVCSNPEILCTNLLKQYIKALKSPHHKVYVDGKISSQSLACFVHLIGEVAINEFVFLDVTVYKELKRRKAIREQRDLNKSRDLSKSPMKTTHNASKLSASASLTSVTSEPGDEVFIEGAVAEDADAEFILRICETEVITTNLLSKFSSMLVNICSNSNVYASEDIQAAASVALVRFMTVSSAFCAANMQLVATMLERSPYPSVRNNIAIMFSDLLCRFPNIVEPWSPKLYARLRDSNPDVKRTTLIVVTSLIMRDMIRVKGHISEIALCIADDCDELVQRSRASFTELAKKGNSLYNVMPEIISRLSNDTAEVEENKFREIMKFIIGLIEKDRHVEALVDKLCSRLQTAESERQLRDLAYCLSLINYNEKMLRVLLERFPAYKSTLQNDDVYALLKGIVNSAAKSAKPEIKTIAAELDERFNTVFTINEAGEKPDGEAETAKAKKPNPPAKKTRRGRKKARCTEDSSMDDD